MTVYVSIYTVHLRISMCVLMMSYMQASWAGLQFGIDGTEWCRVEITVRYVFYPFDTGFKRSDG